MSDLSVDPTLRPALTIRPVDESTGADTIAPRSLQRSLSKGRP
jgi:hypothetical protein